MNDKTFEKINIKIVISVQQCTPLWNFSHFVEFQIMGANMPKNMTDKQFEKINIKIVIRMYSNVCLYIVCTPPFCCGGWTSYQIFIKAGLDRTSTLRRGDAGKEGGNFFQGGCNFYIKKLKSEIFNDKKKFINKNIFSLS